MEVYVIWKALQCIMIIIRLTLKNCQYNCHKTVLPHPKILSTNITEHRFTVTQSYALTNRDGFDSLKEMLQGEAVFLDVSQLLELSLSKGAQLVASHTPQGLEVNCSEVELLSHPLCPAVHLVFSPLSGI